MAATQNHYGSNIKVVFDGYPSDASEKNTNSSERLRRATATSSPDVIFDETTIAPVSQEKFLLNDRNKVRLIDMLKVHLNRNKILTLQAEEDADRLIVTTAISISSTYDVVKICGEDIDLLVMKVKVMKETTPFHQTNQRPLYLKNVGEEKTQISPTQRIL